MKTTYVATDFLAQVYLAENYGEVERSYNKRDLYAGGYLAEDSSYCCACGETGSYLVIDENHEPVEEIVVCSGCVMDGRDETDYLSEYLYGNESLYCRAVGDNWKEDWEDEEWEEEKESYLKKLNKTFDEFKGEHPLLYADLMNDYCDQVLALENVRLIEIVRENLEEGNVIKEEEVAKIVDKMFENGLTCEKLANSEITECYECSFYLAAATIAKDNNRVIFWDDIKNDIVFDGENWVCKTEDASTFVSEVQDANVNSNTVPEWIMDDGSIWWHSIYSRINVDMPILDVETL